MKLYTVALEWLKKTDWIQSTLVGLCLGAGFIVPLLWPFGILGLVWIVYLVQSEVSYKKGISLLVFIFGIKYLGSLAWVWGAFPLTWFAGMNPVLQVVAISLYWVTSSLWLAWGGLFFAAISIWLFKQKYFTHSLNLFLLPFLWLGAEVLGALFFSVFTSGFGSFIQTYFSFGMVGYLLGNTALGLFGAAIGGVYGLSLAAVFLAVVLFFIKQQTSMKGFLVATSLVLLGLFFINPSLVTYLPQGIEVIVIDTEFDAILLKTEAGELFRDDTVATAVNEAVLLKPDFVLLPEDSRYLSSQYNSLYPNQAMSVFQFTHANTNTAVIDSGRYTTNTGRTYLRASVFDGQSKKMWQFDKQYLVPQGEYVPYVYDFVLRMLGYKEELFSLTQNSGYMAGPLMQTADLPAYLPAVLFCFESVSPKGVSSLKKNRPIPFVAHPISHAWFGSPLLLWQQLDLMLQIQARFGGVPIVSAGNMATGKLYLPNGKIEEGEVISLGESYILREFSL